MMTRDQWLQEAEQAESSGAPLTSAAIVKNAIGTDVEEEDRQNEPGRKMQRVPLPEDGTCHLVPCLAGFSDQTILMDAGSGNETLAQDTRLGG